jgi:homoserine O-acetyltransferase
MTRNRDRQDGPESRRSVGWVKAQTIRLADAANPLPLEIGGTIEPVDVEYETYGTLSPAKDNVVLVCHALSGDAHVAGWDADAEASGRTWRQRKPGWWDAVVGPGKALDTRRYFVVCANVLGGCYGTTGPSSTNPATGKPYALDFPMVTVSDWVQLQARLLDALGIQNLYAVLGGSLGGQQVIEWALAFPERVHKCIVLAASARLSAQGLGFNAVGRHAVMHDPDFRDGAYYGHSTPDDGLAAARMLAHITYLSGKGMDDKFGRRIQDGAQARRGFNIEFQVESYLDYQGRAFVERFDANSYLYITRAMDYYDAALRWGDGDLVKACSRIRAQVLVVSFSSDWLYPPDECRHFSMALMRNRIPVSYLNIHSDYGHDAFLVEVETVERLIKGFLTTAPADTTASRCARKGGCTR